MKRTQLLLLIGMLVLFNNTKSQSLQATINEINIAAENYLKIAYPQNEFSIKHIVPLYRDNSRKNDIILYEIITEGGKSLLFSGHKACVPLLGDYYGKDKSLIEELSNNTLPNNIRDFLNAYIEQIEDAFKDEDTVQYYKTEWDILLGNTPCNSIPKAASVGPLINTKWGQGSSNDTDSLIDYYAYNYFIPAVDTCNHALVGCIAVAMGQVMKYWQSPILRISLDQQFDWCRMPSELTSTSPEYIVERNAVAHLLANCAESVNMDYGCPGTGSGASFSAARNALVNRYNYSSSAEIISRAAYNDENWIKMLKKELDKGHPVIYCANRFAGIFDWPGHAFVCDGYDGNYFHINWGWNGTSNGYYFISGLCPDPDHNYLYFHEALFKLYPATPTDVCNITFSLELFYNEYYQLHIPGYGENTPLFIPPYFITPQTLTLLESAPSTSRWEFRTIPTDVTATYQAHEEVHLRDGFTVERGADFTARIVPCPNCEENREAGSPETASAPSNTAPPETTSGYRLPATGYQQPTTDLYPNPTSGEVTVGVDGEVQAIIIYTPMGLPVGGWRLLSIGPDRVTLDLSPLPAGTYILHIQTPMGVSTKRLVVAR